MNYVESRPTRELRDALGDLAEKARHSPEEFVPQRMLARWHKKYVKEAKEAEETPDDEYSNEFYEWIWDRRQRKLRDCVDDVVAGLIRERLL